VHRALKDPRNAAVLSNFRVPAKPIDWDRNKLTVPNDPAANNYIQRPYRPGWTV